MLIDRDKAIEALYCTNPTEPYIHIDDAVKAIKELPSAERTVAHIRDFTQYQIAWLTEHDDLELEPELESWVIRFLKDTADCYEKEYLTSAERKGKWRRVEARVDLVECTSCGYRLDVEPYTDPTYDYCPNCGAHMKGEEE